MRQGASTSRPATGAHDGQRRWLARESQLLVAQPIHGDLHWANIVATSANGFGFIDFDKMMHAPPIFDLAKLIATGRFEIRDRARFHTRATRQLLEGYESLRPLTDTDLVAIDGLAVLLNEETARLGTLYDEAGYRASASAVAAWWIARREQRRSIRSSSAGIAEPAPAPTRQARASCRYGGRGTDSVERPSPA